MNYFSQPVRILSRTAVLLAPAVVSSHALAHVKWFSDDTNAHPLRLEGLLYPPTLLVLGAVLTLTLMALWVWRQRGGRGFLVGPQRLGATAERRSALYGLVPAILAVHLAVPLLVSGVQGQLFSPDNPLPGGWVHALGLIQTGVALALFYGALTRPAAVVLAALWGVGVGVVGLEPMLENIHILGFAAFFFLAGRGPISVDRLLLPRLEPGASLMRHAVPVLRVGIGLGMIVLAVTEKLANLPLALGLLTRYRLNVTLALGLPVPDEVFVLMAGAAELLIGLWLVVGLFPREAIVLAWLPFNLTLTVFNWVELIGHLPYYGAMAVLLLWVSRHEDEALWLAGLREGPLAVLTLPEKHTRPTQRTRQRALRRV